MKTFPSDINLSGDDLVLYTNASLGMKIRNIDKIIPTNIWTHFSSKKEINMFSDIEKRNFLHNAFCFYKTKTLIEIPFDEELKGKEDRYWAKKIVYLNKTYVYNPIIKCNHYFTDRGATWKDV